MPEIKRSWDLLPKESRDDAIRKIITYFNTEKEMEIGILGATEILDFFLQISAETIYNQAVQDTKKIIQEKLADLEVDLDLLLKK